MGYSARPPLHIGKHDIPCARWAVYRPVQKHSTNPDLPWVGYMDYCLIKSARSEANRRRLCRGQRDSDFYIRLRRISPKDWTADPYVVFALLSIAQRQYNLKGALRNKIAYRVCIFPRRRHTDENILLIAKNQACLVVTNAEFPDDAILFDAEIPKSLLDELEDPGTIPQRRPWLVIERSRISFEPERDFRSRLVAALSSKGDGNAVDREGKDGSQCTSLGDLKPALSARDKYVEHHQPNGIENGCT